jgi:hypothetical protein
MVGIVFGEIYCTFSVVFYLLLSFFSFLLFSFTLIAILLFVLLFFGGIKGLAPPALYIIHDCHVFASGVLKISMGHRVS